MTASVKRQAVLVVTWIVVTVSATAMAWWSVTLVTAEVADRRPLRPSDVVAASARQAVPVPSWAYSGESVMAPAAVSSNPPAALVGAGNPADLVTVGTGVTTAQVAVSVSGADRPPAHQVDNSQVAGWSPAPGTPTAANVSLATDVAMTVTTPVPVEQAPPTMQSSFAVHAFHANLTSPVAAAVTPAVTMQPPVIHAAAVHITLTSPVVPATTVQPTVKMATTSPATVQPATVQPAVPPATWWTSHRSPVPASTPTATPAAPYRHRRDAGPAVTATAISPEPAPPVGTAVAARPASASAARAGRHPGAAE